MLSMLDWISPAIATAREIRGYRPISVYWDGTPPVQYQRALQRAGIPAQRGVIVSEGWTILVPRADLGRARDLLCQWGAPLAVRK